MILTRPEAEKKVAAKAKPRQVIRASRIDNAESDRALNFYWSGADGKQPSDAQRRIVRRRARQEALNNSHLKGMLLTLCNDTIGARGPILQTKEAPEVATAWRKWARAINLPEILRTARLAKARDGEVFIALNSNPNIKGDIKLQPRIIDAELIESVILDDWGHPTAYVISNGFLDKETIPAEAILHWFAGSETVRGFSEIAPALHLLTQLKRYTNAVIKAADTAANLSMVIETTSRDGDVGIEVPDAGELLDLSPNQALTLPVNSKLSQLKAEQPTANFEAVQKIFIAEAGRNLQMPRGIALNDSSSYNFSSARLDMKNYERAIEAERTDLEIEILEPMFESFLLELTLARGKAYPDLEPTFFHQPFPYIDPLKEFKADSGNISYGLDGLSNYYASRGMDWEEQAAKNAIDLNLSVADYKKMLVAKYIQQPLPDVTAELENE